VKPVSEFRIGTEHEKTPFTLRGASPRAIRRRAARHRRACWRACSSCSAGSRSWERGNIIGLYDVTGGGAISLEPGGQFELSGAPVEKTVHQTQSETDGAPGGRCARIATPLGIGFSSGSA